MLRRATQLDPSFVEAWEDLSLADYSLQETKRAGEDLKHAFDLREKLPDSSPLSCFLARFASTR